MRLCFVNHFLLRNQSFFTLSGKPLSRLLSLLFHISFADCDRKLIGTTSAFHPTLISFQLCLDLIDRHAIDQFGDRLQISVASACEFDICNFISIQVKRNSDRAYAFVFMYISITL